MECGVDVVIAQGWEAGGHVRGRVATMPLVPAVIDAVGPVPVIAAGGIADGRGLAAALALGASGAWIGTRFLASNEAVIHPHYRERILRATEDDTVYLEDLFDIGWPKAPHRVLRNNTVAPGKPPDVRLRASGPVRARSWLPRNPAGQSCGIDPTHPRPTPRAISMPCRFGPVRVLALSARSSLPRRSCGKSTAKPTLSCMGSLNSGCGRSHHPSNRM